jgi:hypothetical protein
LSSIKGAANRRELERLVAWLARFDWPADRIVTWSEWLAIRRNTAGRRRHLTPRMCQAMFRHLRGVGLLKLHPSPAGFTVDRDACRAWKAPWSSSPWRRRTRQPRIDPFAGFEV